jgi:hypothetical protein
MKPFFFVLACFVLVTNDVTAQNVPQGLPPAFKVVVSTNPDKGELIFLDTVIRYVTEERFVQENVNGVQITKTVKVQVPVIEQRHILTDIGKGRVITPDGKQLPIEEVWKRLKANSVVLVSGDMNTPAPAYLRALNAETLVVIPAPPVPMKK